MTRSVLIAGIGNIFHGDDGFGVAVVRKLAALELPRGVRVGVRIMDIGIRSVDLAFAVFDGYDLIILVDITQRGGAPGTVYTIEIDPEKMPDECDEASIVNAHELDPMRVLMLAKNMGATLKRVLLVGCEPHILSCEETGYIGLSEAVEAAIVPAIENIRHLVEEFMRNEAVVTQQEVCSYERT